MNANPALGAIVVAAGSGTRMGGLDKLFTEVAGRPLLAHAIASFQECAVVERIVLVMAAENLERGTILAHGQDFSKVRDIVPGGKRRQDSVRLGLDALGECEYVAVHDGGRPLVTIDLIERGLAVARETGAAVPALPLVDTVKEVGPDELVVGTLDRRRLCAAQTPQIFRRDLLMRAHREITADVTDDAAMLEALGVPVRLFPGDRCNIKVTTPEDLELIRGAFGSPATVLHVIDGDSWEQAKAAGEYRSESLAGEGFIHCCTDAQLPYVLQTYFAGTEGLVLLRIDLARTSPEIRWADSGPGGPFPHIYGPLNLDAVVAVEEVQSR